MIDIQNKASCTGCYACVRICPKQCISMQPDEEGFWYPSVDKGICVDCGLCEKVCAVAHPFPIRQPLATYAARSKQAKYLSLGSSGGIFQPLAERVIADGGVVFGARFNEHWEVIHDKAEVPEELPAFSGSKYVQSRTGDTYREAEGFLKAGRKVLFSGTPCQIAGLYAYLRKPYENLYTVDLKRHLPYLNIRYIQERFFSAPEQVVNLPSSDYYIEGYWQSERYFEDYRDQIRKDFRIIKPISDSVREEEKMIQELGDRGIALCVRRYQEVKKFVNLSVIGKDYYLEAMKCMARQVQNPVFICFSQTPEWVKEHLSDHYEIRYIIPKDYKSGEIDDLFLLT